LNWNPPENYNETVIDFYELTLIGTPISNTYFHRATTEQIFSFKYVLSEGNYTAVRITVIDLCEQRSEPSQIMLSNINDPTVATISESITNPQIDDKNKKRTIDILATVVALMIALEFITIMIAAMIIRILKVRLSKLNDSNLMSEFLSHIQLKKVQKK
jgi:hypothetical protein